MTLYKLFSIVDKNTNIILIQDKKRILISPEIESDITPFFPYSVTRVVHKNRQLRIFIDNEKTDIDLDDKEKVYLKDIMLLLDNGEKLALSKDLSENTKRPIDTIKVSPLDVLIVT